jgi:hypothetical protein
MQGEEFFYDLNGSKRAGKTFGVSTHKGKTLRVIEEGVNFISEDGDIIAANGDALFEEVV